MGSVLQCLVRICCDPDGDENDRRRNRLTATARGERHASSESSAVVRALMARENITGDNNEHLGSPSSAPSLHSSSENRDFYQRAASFPGTRSSNNTGSARNEAANNVHHSHHRLGDREEEEDDNDEDDICCQGRSRPHNKKEQHPEVRGIFDFFHQLQQRWQYDSLGRARADTAGTSEEIDGNNSMSSPVFSSPKQTKGKPPHSPLRTALTFDTSRGNIPTIRPEEVVLPGSLLQKQMAESMSLLQKKQQTDAAAGGGALLDCHEDECVICMESFTSDNPRMPTLCGCGENKAYFHLPCLYQWMDISPDCPSCRQALRWQEFS